MTTVMATAPHSLASAGGFDDRFVEALNHGALMLMASIGHRSGLFDAMARLDWAGSEGIASQAGLDERYVREWLGAMATGGVVEVDDRGRYRLPVEHAQFLTRAAGGDNLAVFAQYIGVLAQVEDDILGCFERGGGLDYDRFPRFHEVMAEDSAATVLSSLEDSILPLVPGLVERLEQGIDVLDLGCGRGKALMQLAERFPNSRFRGLDISSEALDWAQREAQEKGLRNLDFEVRDATDFDRTAQHEAFDLVTTFDAVHDQSRPRAVLAGIYKTLRPGGIYLMQDIHSSSHVHQDLEHPLGTFLYTISCLHCMTVSLSKDGEGLGAMWGREKALELLGGAGFGDVGVHRLPHDVQNDYFVARKGS